MKTKIDGHRGGRIVDEDSTHLGHYHITINLSLNTHNKNAVDCKETIQRPWLESSSCVVWRERATHHLLMARATHFSPGIGKKKNGYHHTHSGAQQSAVLRSAINSVCRALLSDVEKKQATALSTAIHVSSSELKFAKREKSPHIIILCS